MDETDFFAAISNQPNISVQNEHISCGNLAHLVEHEVPEISSDNISYGFWLWYDSEEHSLLQLYFSGAGSNASVYLSSTDLNSGENIYVYTLPFLGWKGIAYNEIDKVLFLVDCGLKHLYKINISLANQAPPCYGWEWTSGSVLQTANDHGCEFNNFIYTKHKIFWMEDLEAQMSLLSLHYDSEMDSLFGVFEVEEYESGELSIQIWSIRLDASAKVETIIQSTYALEDSLESFVSTFDDSSKRLFIFFETCSDVPALVSVLLNFNEVSNSTEMQVEEGQFQNEATNLSQLFDQLNSMEYK